VKKRERERRRGEREGGREGGDKMENESIEKGCKEK
jgi:hypothetical protein